MIMFLLGIIAFALDLGYIVLVRTQLQAAADAAAMAAAATMSSPRNEMIAEAQRYAGYHVAGGRVVKLRDVDVEYGTWDATRRIFTTSEDPGNAVRVTAHADSTTNGERSLFFGKIFNHISFPAQASAVAMANPRDIAFVVDLSGSMNDDTEPCWATNAIDSTFGTQGYPTIGTDLMKQVYQDFGFGAYPGVLEYLGAPAGVPQDSYAYAELTKDEGYLANVTIPATYRILPEDSESVRKQKAYSWIIDYQIARVMPEAKPTPISGVNYAYWERYLDYLSIGVTIYAPSPSPPSPPSEPTPPSSPPPSDPPPSSPPPTPPPPPPTPPMGYLPVERHGVWFTAWMRDSRHRDSSNGRSPGSEIALAMASPVEDAVFPLLLLGAASGTPPENRGSIPPNRYSGRIYKFNNPNTSSFPQVSTSVPRGYRNWIGYLTYVQFMMDHGRDIQPLPGCFVPLSRFSPDCPWHPEETAGGTFAFPPREQPAHAARRALIAAIQIIKERNSSIPDLRNRDWVSVISYDSLSNGGPQLVLTLTGDYDQAMQACTQLQACGDLTATTATETGLIAARNHLKPQKDGGQGRLNTNKVIVLLTDGMPNLYSSDTNEINAFIGSSPNRQEFYNNGAYWYDAALMQSAIIQNNKWSLYPVGIGLGTDYDFMDRMARLGGTADQHGQSPRSSGNPAEYEQRLTDIFRKIVTSPQMRLVQ
jgi:Flp pilus assembly protein TadG